MTQTKLSGLPAIGAQFQGGKFAAVLTDKTGTPYVLVFRGTKAKGLHFQAAQDWATSQDGDSPTPAEAAMLVERFQSELPDVFWLNKTRGASLAWYCYSRGTQFDGHRSSELGAVSVSRFPLGSFDPLGVARDRMAHDIANLRASAQALLAACVDAEALSDDGEEAPPATIDSIFKAVLDAMQNAEELGSIDGSEYSDLMRAIAAEALTRMANYKASQRAVEA